jgi:hypothetical protein
VRNASRIFVETVKGRDYWVCKHRWEDSIKINFTEAVCEGMDWIYLRMRPSIALFVNKVLNFQVIQIGWGGEGSCLLY